MQYANYSFYCRFTSATHVSAFKGSAIRGLFGLVLKKTVCALRLKECDSCILQKRCVYFQMFETQKTGAVNKRGKILSSALPHPFVLEPPLDLEQTYQAGDSFVLGLTLFGNAVEYLPYLVYCLELMGKYGLGKHRKDGSGRFELIRVTRGERIIFDEKEKTLKQDMEPGLLCLDAFASEPVNEVTVRFLTPLRIKYRNHLVDRLDFHILVRACLRRISLLEETFGQGEPDLDYSGLVKLAESVVTRKHDLKWQEVTRYSNRQKRLMNIGGVTGSVTYQGELSPFIPILKYCEVTHVGKLTAFGHGKIKVHTENGP